jgi:hypothetical protein
LWRVRRLLIDGQATAEDDMTTDGHLEHLPGDGTDDTDLPDRNAERDADRDMAGAATGDRPRWRGVAAWVTTALACLLVLFALVAPNRISGLTPWAFVRIPAEGVLGVALVLALPPRARRIAAAVVGAFLGLLTITKFLDMGFYETLARPFDLMYDWSFLGPGMEFLSGAIGKAGAIAAAVGAVVVALAVVVFMTLAAVRLTRVMVGHRRTTTRTVGVLAMAWVVCAAFSVQIIPGVPVASKSAAALAYGDLRQVHADIKQQQAFAREVKTDAFAGTSGDELLTGLRGKDVIVTFVESYGRVAVEGQDIAPGVDALLDAGTEQLKAAGYGARSAFVTSSTFGGGSWLAHSTLQSGLWVDNQQRYDHLVGSDRMTLSGAFRKAGWRTVGQVPEHNRDWPEGQFFGYEQYYDARNVGYEGPNFFYALMPDQYTLSAFQRLERSRPGHAPVMAEIDLVTSHTPWVPLPKLVDWKDVGDGSVFKPMPAAGQQPEDVWPDPVKVRAAYGESIQYSLSTLISYVRTYGDRDLVLVFLGDHQPAPIVSGENASRDVPVTIVAGDQAVLDRIAGWGWHDGLNPGPQAPVWPMSALRDRLLTAFGPQVAARTK